MQIFFLFIKLAQIIFILVMSERKTKRFSDASYRWQRAQRLIEDEKLKG